MSDVDPTPETPVTLGDRMAWWRGDVAARLTTLEQQVSALAGSPTGTLAALRADLAALRGTDSRNLSELYNKIYDGLFYEGETAKYPAHIRLNAELQSISERLDYIQAALGAEPYNSLELANVRGLLHAILTNAQSFGIAPDFANGVFISADTYTAEGKRYIIWPSATGIVRAGGNGFPVGTIISPVTTWSGYQLYIKSNAPVAYSGATEYPVNSWFDLSGNSAYTFHVDSGYNVTGYIRVPVNTCILSPVAVRYSSNGKLTNFYGFQWPDNLGYATRNTDLTGAVYTPINFLVGDFTGWTVRVDRTQSITVQGITFTSKNQMLTITSMANAPYLFAYSLAPFQIRLCPPGSSSPEFP